jgi:Uma2 family endonuclease
MSAHELLTYVDPHDRRTELVRGRLVVSEPPGFAHGRVALAVGAALLAWVRTRERVTGTRIGLVAANDPGCWIEHAPDTVLAPDVAFVAAARLPATGVAGFLDGAPTLAVEVLSPTDRAGAVGDKVAQWLAAGTTLVWVVDPARRVARVHRRDGSVVTIAPDGALTGEDVLPGFVLPLADAFD